MTRLRVAFAGPHITFQDAGRLGMMRFGVPASGPMDRKAFAIAQSVLATRPRLRPSRFRWAVWPWTVPKGL